MRPDEILTGIIKQYGTVREFARAIDEDPADIYLWKTGRRKITARAVVSIIKQHPDFEPYELNPWVFEKGMTFQFKKDK